MVRQNSHQRTNGHRALDDELTAIQKQDGARDSQNRTRRRAGEVRSELHVEKRLDEAAIALPEPIYFVGLGSRGDHQAHALQRLDQEAADLGAPFAHRAHLTGEPVLEVRNENTQAGNKTMLTRNIRQFSQTMIAYAAHQRTMFASRARTESADTRWTSLMSCLIRGNDVAHPRVRVEARRKRL